MTLDTEVAELIEREKFGGGVGDDDWASTVARKPSPRRRVAARRRVRGGPTMATMVVGGREGTPEKLAKRSVGGG